MTNKTKKALKLLGDCRLAREQMINGIITIDQAKVICQIYVDFFNKESIKIAKQFNKKPYKINTTGFLR